LNYRYEIVKKLGRGAFGVVIRCIDHAHPQKEHVAMKILKNKKKLHKQGKIEIKILTMLRDDDPEEKRNVVAIRDQFTFRNHVVSIYFIKILVHLF
jgi:dual specificity tyrosine-phosphorylation-regulated kinase 2/3/4